MAQIDNGKIFVENKSYSNDWCMQINYNKNWRFWRSNVSSSSLE